MASQANPINPIRDTQISSDQMDDTTLVSFNYQDESGILRSQLIELKKVRDLTMPGTPGICGDPKKIIAVAKTIYSRMNPDYYKTYISLSERVCLWILDLFSSQTLAKRLVLIVGHYAGQRDVNLPFLIKEKDDEPLLFSSQDADSPTIPESPDWANPASFRNLLLDEEIKKHPSFPHFYDDTDSRKLLKDAIAAFKKDNPLIVADLKEKIDDQYITPKKRPDSSSDQGTLTHRKVRVSRDNPLAFSRQYPSE